MSLAPAIPSNTPSLRRPYFRSVRQGLEALAERNDPGPLTHVLDKMDRWISKAQSTGVVDPRIDWMAWTRGDMAWAQPSDTKPLPQILAAPFVPLALKARALDLTRTIETLCPYWVEVDNRASSYGRIQPETWLMAANVPGIAEFVRERETTAGLAGRPLDDPDRPSRFEASWSDAWRNLLVEGTDWLGSMMKGLDRSPESVYRGAFRSTHERTIFHAAVQHGWGTVDILDTWPGRFASGRNHPATQRLRTLPLDTTVPGALIDVLAADEPVGGLLDDWRAAHAHDWSTWISPTTGTTVWRSLLLNETPSVLTRWLRDDPAALDRPVPNGRWARDEDGLGNRRRTFAGTTWNERDLEEALQQAQDPEERRRLNAWWDDSSPTLRTTVWALTQHLFPIQTPFLEHADWYALHAVIEGIDLRAEVDAQRQTLGPFATPPRPRSRL